jgi:hypothetical protein
MEITGTIEHSDGSTERLTFPGATYEAAKAALEAGVPEGTKLIAIRTDR